MIQQSPSEERAREVLARHSLPALMNGVAPVVHVDAAIRAMIEFASQAAQPAEEASGTFACPICGKDSPHHHTAPMVDAYQNKRSRK